MLEEEEKRIVLAQKVRGIDYSLMSKKEKFKNIPTLFFPIITSGIQNAVHLAVSMEVRGYGNGATRTRLKNYIFRKNDYIYTILIFIVCILFIISSYLYK